jgi:hypothetical protein
LDEEESLDNYNYYENFGKISKLKRIKRTFDLIYDDENDQEMEIFCLSSRSIEKK